MSAIKKPNTKLDQAFSELLQAFAELENELDKKFADDEEGFSTAILEAIESAIDTAIEDTDSSTGAVAQVLAAFTEALEEIDPSAFDEVEDDDEDDSDYDLEDADIDDYDEDEDEEEDDDDER